VTKEDLGDIVSSAGMLVTAVRTLYQAGHLKQDPNISHPELW